MSWHEKRKTKYKLTEVRDITCFDTDRKIWGIGAGEVVKTKRRRAFWNWLKQTGNGIVRGGGMFFWKENDKMSENWQWWLKGNCRGH